MRAINKQILLLVVSFIYLVLASRSSADALLTLNNGGIGTFSVNTNTGITAVNPFIPTVVTGAGFGLAIRYDTNNDLNSLIYYTFLHGTPAPDGSTPPPDNSDGVHICPYGTNGSGGAEIGLIPNPDGTNSGNGINALAIHNGDLYLLSGGFDQPLHIWIWHQTTSITNGIMHGPIFIGPPACLRTNYYGPYMNSYAFTVLPNGNYLIADTYSSPAFREYDKSGGLKPGGLFIDLSTFDASLSVYGVCMSSDLQSIYFNVGSGIAQTDLSGNVLQIVTDATVGSLGFIGVSDLNNSALTNEPGSSPPTVMQLSPLGYTAFTNAAYTSTTLVSTQRVQQVYKASQFPPESILITALRFRPAEAPYGSAFSTTISNIQINLSTTTNPPNGLSTTFSSNIGSNNIVVYSGPLSISSAYTGNDNGPRDNDIIIPLQTPYTYSPANGNLLLDIRNFSGDPGNHAYTSTFNTTNDTGSRVASSNPNATTGSADTAADEVTFVYQGANICAVPNYTAYTGSTNISGTLHARIRIQEVYKSLQFPSAPILITELRFRPAAAPYGSAFTNLSVNLQINLSTTTNPPDGLSTNFADNIGSDDQIAYSGFLNITNGYTGDDSGTSPRDADIIIPLQTPFSYDPSKGNLLLDINHWQTESPQGTIICAFNGTNDAGSRVYTFDDPSTPSGVADSQVDAVNFVYQGEGSVFAPNYSAYSIASASSATLIVTQRIQQVYSFSQFPPAQIKITELRFRSGLPPYGGAFSTTIGNIQINLSTTSHTPGGLSTTFANNVGSDDTNVYSGSLHISSANTGGNTGPKDADIVVHLQKPFIYDPSKGNLLMDIRHLSDDTGNGAYTMCFGESDDAGSRVVGLNPNATTASFSDTGVDAVNFIYTDASQ